MNKYILNGHTPTLCNDLLQWSQWFETADRVIARDEINGVVITTVFLGIDHNFGSVGPPILFETMVFGGSFDQHQERYTTWQLAEIGHQQTIERVRESEQWPEELS